MIGTAAKIFVVATFGGGSLAFVVANAISSETSAWAEYGAVATLSVAVLALILKVIPTLSANHKAGMEAQAQHYRQALEATAVKHERTVDSILAKHDAIVLRHEAREDQIRAEFRQNLEQIVKMRQCNYDAPPR